MLRNITILSLILFISGCVNDENEEKTSEATSCENEETRCGDGVLQICKKGTWTDWNDCKLDGLICSTREGKNDCYAPFIEGDTESGSKDSETSDFGGENIKDVPTTISEDFKVLSSTIGRSYEDSSYFNGVIIVEYQGDSDLSFTEAYLDYYTKDDLLLLSEWTLVYSPVLKGYSSSLNNNPCTLDSANNIGYIYLISEVNIDAIKRIEVEIESSTGISFTDPHGNLSIVGDPYSVERDSWYFDIINGDIAVQESFSIVLFKDKDDKVWNWDFPSLYEDGDYANDNTIEIAGERTLRSIFITPDYLDALLKPEMVLLQWDGADEPDSLAKMEVRQVVSDPSLSSDAKRMRILNIQNNSVSTRAIMK